MLALLTFVGSTQTCKALPSLAHDVRSFAPLDERYFGELCFYSDAHDALLRNKGALLDPHAFGEAFDASLEVMDAWQTVRHSRGATSTVRVRFRAGVRVRLRVTY